MKPTLAMDEKPAATIIQTPELPYQGRQSIKSRWMHAGFSIVLAMLAVILVFQVLSYRHLKEHSEKDMQKNIPEKVEKNVNYHIEENDETVNEKVVVDDREEDVTTQKARMIFDYKRSIVVTKFTDGEADDDAVCYVASFNKSGNTDDLKEAYLNAEDDQEAHLEDHDEAYESTDETVPRDLLSPRAQQMCENSKVIMLRETEKKELDEAGDRKKRALCYRRYLRCYLYGVYWRCYYLYYFYWC